MSLRKTIGLDASIAYASTARMVGIAGSTGTVLLIVRCLNPIEQGYYYTLLSLVSLQMVFELGFSFVIQQLAAHECVHLEIAGDGSVSGDAAARARLASALRLTLRWYTVAAVTMGLLLAPMGAVFFARHGSAASAAVAWHGPWLMAVTASAAGLWFMPLYSFLEGCGQIRAVAALRLRQAVATVLFAWPAMLLHHGLFAPALALTGQVITGLLFVFTRRALLLGLLGHRSDAGRIEWNREVWPFQWRIAVSWMCTYFTAQIFIPILFAVRGAVEAGQMGMSLSITGYMTALVLPWITTKATPFGRMIAQREFARLDRLFLRTLNQALGAFAAIAVCAAAAAVLLALFWPRLAHRMTPPRVFAVLILAAGANCVVQCLATLLRSFKREPFFVQSLAVAAVTLALASAAAHRWGTAGVALTYFAAMAGIALPSAVTIFVRARRRYLAIETPAEPGRDETRARQRRSSALPLRLGVAWEHRDGDL